MNKGYRSTLAAVLAICALAACSRDEAMAAPAPAETAPMPAGGAVAETFEVTPVSHATSVLRWADKVIYLDPVGGAEAFAGMDAPDLVLVTDIHGDHFSADTLTAVVGDGTVIVAPQAVIVQLPEPLAQRTTMLANGQSLTEHGLSIEAIPMYNLPESADAFHPKGRGNGYVIEREGLRIYVAGDTEDVPEMRALQDIDVAFIPMNLPYTMTVEDAADGVLAFAPKRVYPYHFRGTEGLSDVEKFKSLVNSGNPDIEVELFDWYSGT